MPPSGKSLEQKNKLAHSYSELLSEFSSTELKTVGNYNLGRLIGKGSFGKVYLATHRLTNGSKVVLKSAKKDDANLAREIHHHRQFVHPHIARLYEVIVTETLVWLVLEYCAGDELYNYLLKNGALEPSKAQRVFTQLVGAVSYVHQQSCVHRDLKLENILLDKHENVKLVDFGFTREYDGRSSYLQTWCGTVCYAAPEMLRGEKYAGEKVDVWSLGIILYALLCGELPFDEDDENDTKNRILKEEPQYPDHIPEQAKDLVSRLLSKRPLLRPSLAEILQHPWLADHAPQQQGILKLQQPAPFTTELEKDTLQRMRSAGVDIDAVIENVLSQRCDGLAGWWALLIEKEERKAKRRDRRRKEREAEVKSIRRLSAASSRLERVAPTIRETEEEGQQEHSLQVPGMHEPGRGRPRQVQRKPLTSTVETPKLSEEVSNEQEMISTSQTNPSEDIGKNDRIVGLSPSRPPPPPKEISPPQANQVQQSTPSDSNMAETVANPKRKFQNPLLNQLVSLKQWLRGSARRTKTQQQSRSGSLTQSGQLTQASHAYSTRRLSNASVGAYRYSNSHLRDGSRIGRPAQRSVVSNTVAGSSVKRPSMSPHTPQSSYRRSSAGLRGRKSTSSSVSSIRSVHHHHTHSKASSVSSASGSLASPTIASSKIGRSPHNSVKILPATPTTSMFPSNIRVVRTPSVGEAGAAFSSLPPSSPGLIFARRKRSPFKGPTLSLDVPGSGGSASRSRGKTGSRSGSLQGRRSGEIIEEEDEDEIEEVDEFSPMNHRDDGDEEHLAEDRKAENTKTHDTYIGGETHSH